MRSTIHLGHIALDVTLPTNVVLAELIPPLTDLAIEHGAEALAARRASHLWAPGPGTLDSTKTLAELPIRGGSVLVLTDEPVPGPESHMIPAPVVSERHLNGSLAAVLISSAAAGLVGFSVLGAGPAVPRVLLGSAAATTVVGLAGLAAPALVGALRPIALSGALVAVAALCGTIFGLDMPQSGVVLTMMGLALLSTAGRIALMLADPGSSCSRLWMDQMVLSAAAVIPAGLVASGARSPSPAVCVLTCVAALVLLTRARAPGCAMVRAFLIGTGTLCAAIFLVIAMSAIASPVPLVGAVAGAAIAHWCAHRGLHPESMIDRLLDAAQALALLVALPAAAAALGLIPGLL